MPLLRVKNSLKEKRKMNKEVIAKRSTAALNQVVAIVLIVIGVLLFIAGIVLYTSAIRDNSPMVLRILFIVLFGALATLMVTLGIVQVFDNDENARLYSFPLISYSKEEDVFYAYDLKNGGNEVVFKKEEFVKLFGPSILSFGRVYLTYKKDGQNKRVFIGFARIKK